MLRDVKGHTQVISWQEKNKERNVSNPGIDHSY